MKIAFFLLAAALGSASPVRTQNSIQARFGKNQCNVEPQDAKPTAVVEQPTNTDLPWIPELPDDTALPNTEQAGTRVFNAEAMTKLCKHVQFTREQCQSLYRTCFAKAPRLDDDKAQKQLQACASDFIQKQSAYAKTETPQNGPGQNTSKAPVRSNIRISIPEDISTSDENALFDDLNK
ncbi:hypothetical protein NHJ6243_010166 [Beauveria neobassiana]